ncbi:TadE-like protein [Methylobacillus rhizosphaerae]|uniref:TadE-like protein n=1 Tax=Methylobacillus rhizosphaerae TaxID=551994 RepID=A0A238YKD1_9PROT|nr:TadE/TadG family type IV pilus assembly protein [Methylobacillus rhizosphaerae]SNR71442.1 TadE-like protein [Methylobacillus rhizosphaerae]
MVMAVKGKKQQGAAAIEFALVFVLFLVVLYAIISYAIIFLLWAGLNFAASEGARSAIAVDPLAFSNDAAYVAALEARAHARVDEALVWMPPLIRTKIQGAYGSQVSSVVEDATRGKVINVRLIYPNYVSDPVVPILNFPGYGPLLPTGFEMRGWASVSLG